MGGRDHHGLGLIYRIAALMHAGSGGISSHNAQLRAASGGMDHRYAYATIVLPFLAAYWKWSCHSVAFHYSAPARTAKALDSAFSSGDYIGFVRGLSVVAHSLCVALDQSEVELLRIVR